MAEQTPLSDAEKKGYNRAFGILGHVLNNENEGERNNSCSTFLNVWNSKENPKNFETFCQWLEQDSDLKDDIEAINDLLTKAAELLEQHQAGNAFTTAYSQYVEKLNEQNAQIEMTAIMNDICSMLYEAKKQHAAGQKESAKTFTDQANTLISEYKVDKDVLRAHQQKRQDVLIDLFKKGDLLNQTKAPFIKEKLEQEFADIALEYGFLDPDSNETTAEFNQEYDVYLADRDAYMKLQKKSKPNDQKTKAADQNTSADDTGTDNGQGDDNADLDDESYEDPLAPEPEPVTHVHTFPIRDAKGDLSAFTASDNYTDALKEYISKHTGRKTASLSIDFETDAITVKKDLITVMQHSAVTGWTITASENLTWNSSSPEIIISDTKIETPKGEVTVGSASDLKADIAEGSFKATAKLENSEISIKQGNMDILGRVSGGSYDVKKGDLSLSASVENAKITVKGDLEAKSAITDTEITLNKGSTAQLRDSIKGGSIKADSNVAFTKKASTAKNTKFIGHIPASPNLRPSEFQKGQNENNIRLAEKVAAQMPELFFEAMGMGRAETYKDGKRIKSPLFWKTRAFNLSNQETSFIKDLLSGLRNGLDTPFIALEGAKSKQKKDILNIEKFLEENKTAKLVVFPIFKDKETATKSSQDLEDHVGPYHYRLAFFANKKQNLNLNETALFDKGCDKTGYPKNFWKNFDTDLILDISTPSMFDPEITGQYLSYTIPPNFAQEIINSKWLQSDVSLFQNFRTQDLDGASSDIKDNIIQTPFILGRFAGYLSRNQTSPRVNYDKILKKLHKLLDEKSKDWEALPVLRSDVFKSCIFEGLNTEFYTDELTNTTLSQFKGTAYAGGNLGGSTVTDKSTLNVECIGDTNINGVTIDGKSTINLNSFHQNNIPIQIDANELKISESDFNAKLGPEALFNFKKAKLQKTKITIAGAKSIDFTDSEFEDCEITISSVTKAAFNNAQFKRCKVKIKGDDVDFTSATVSDLENTIDLKTTTALFKGATLIGKTAITGEAEHADFEGAQIGDNITSSEDLVSYKLKSDRNNYNNAKFGNVAFLPTSNTDTHNTKWDSVKVVGRVSAAGTMAQVLYPLFGKAANLDQETKAPKQAGNNAHPGRSFALDLDNG